MQRYAISSNSPHKSFKERSGCYSLCHRRLRHRPMHLLSYGVRLRAYACGTGWLWVCLHYGVTVSSCAVIGPSRNGTSADHKPGLLHRDGVGI